MTIEKINDRQIRFILTEEELSARQIRLSEFAYGTDKARDLFREMMQQAVSRYGFEMNGPLMIEAIPMRSGSIVLIVTRVDNPEEADPRFANYAPSVQNGSASQTSSPSALELLEHLLEALCTDDADPESSPQDAPRLKTADPQQEALQKFREFSIRNRLYLFPSMDAVIRAAAAAGGRFTGESLLFREDGIYSLLLKMSGEEEAQAMQGILAELSEYGNPVPVTISRQQYLEEHGLLVIASGALETLTQLQ